MAKHRPATRARRFLLPLLMTATAIVFLAPAAQAAPTVITVTKTAAPPEGQFVSPGDVITYSVQIANGTGDVATGITLSDPLPSNTTYVAGSASTTDGTVTNSPTYPFDPPLALLNIPQGGSTTATFQATVDDPLPLGTSSISNTATVGAGNAAAGSDLSDDAVHQVPSQLRVTKSADPLPAAGALPGQEIEYSILVENDAASPVDATGVKVRDVTPANTTYVPDSAEEAGAPIIPATTNPFEPAGGYTLADPTLSPGETRTLTFQVRVNTPLPNNTKINNTATATATNAAGPVTSSTQHNVTSIPGLTVAKSSTPTEGGSVTPGTVISYFMVVTNDLLATETATGVVLTDATPANTTYVAGSAKIDGVTVPDSLAPPFNPFEGGEALPDMAPGDSLTATFNVTLAKPLDNGTQIANTATVSSDQLPDSSDGATLTVASAPKLTLVKSSAPMEGGKVTPGTTIVYSIVITNAADATEKAKLLKLLDPTPANTSYVAGSGTLNGNAVSGTGNPFGTAFTLPDLAPGASHTVTFSAKVSSPLAKGTVISNIAKLTGQNHPDVQDAATHTVDSAPVLKLTLSASPKPGTKVEEGDTISYQIVVQNDAAATESLNSVVVAAPTPDGTSFVEGSARVDGTTVSSPDTSLSAASTSLAAPGPFPGGFALGTMAPGTSHTLTYRVRVKPDAGEITNTVTVTAANATATVATISHRGPGGGSGGSGNGSGNGGGSGTETGGTGTETGGTGVTTTSGDSLAFTGLDLARLLLLALTLLLAGWTLVARGRAVQRRAAGVRTHETSPSTGSAMVDRWVDSFFYPRMQK